MNGRKCHLPAMRPGRLFAAVLCLAIAGLLLAGGQARGAAVKEKIQAGNHVTQCIKGSPVTVDPAVWDFGERLTVVQVKKPWYGGKTKLLGPRSIRYTPGAGTAGYDRFAYVIKDRYGQRATGWMTVILVDEGTPNEPPRAGRVSASTFAGTPRLINIEREVADKEGRKLTVSSVGSPQIGTVSITRNNLIRYLPFPSANRNGPYAAGTDGAAGDQFSYTVTDEAGASSTGQVNVIVRIEPHPRTVGDGTGSTEDDRGGLRYGGTNGCSEGTLVTLNVEAGAPANQQVCGVLTTDSTASSLYFYKGIQYAEAPRWAESQPPQWSTLSAVEYGPVCPQGDGNNTDAMNEECLYLNVWTPKITPDNSGSLPVMVFIHGGAFISGSGGSAEGDLPGHLNLYDGSEFVATSRDGAPEIVFVTLNYRLGVLGFLAGDKLGLNGNFGIKDQTKALQWVQRNISLFGGDPSQVMIFGESAGAQSTALHLTITADNHQALFQRAVLESNYGITYMPVAEAQAKADAFAKAEGCDTAGSPAAVLACLRGKEFSELLEYQAKRIGAYPVEYFLCAGLQAIIPWNPVIDGVFITRNPVNAAITKPMMLGSNLSESVPFLAVLKDYEMTPAYFTLTDFLFGTSAAKVIRDTYLYQYLLKTDRFRFQQVVTDYLWTCFNRKLAANSSAEVYRYHYVHHGSFSVWVDKQGQVSGPVPEACAQKGVVCHADELPFVFGNPTDDQYITQTFTAAEANMSLALRKYWIAFARASDPNVAGQTPWPLNGTGNILQIDAPGSAITAVSSDSIAGPAHCDALWDNLVGYEVTSSFSCGSF